MSVSMRYQNKFKIDGNVYVVTMEDGAYNNFIKRYCYGTSNRRRMDDKLSRDTFDRMLQESNGSGSLLHDSHGDEDGEIDISDQIATPQETKKGGRGWDT